MTEFSDRIDDFDPKVFGFDVAVPGSDKTMVCMDVEALRGICARIAELEAERAELVKDRERLDWLDSDLPQYRERAFHWHRDGGDVRQAIDAAREGE